MLRKILAVLVLASASTAAIAQVASQPKSSDKKPEAPDSAKPADYSQEAFVIEKQAYVYRFENDGAGYRRETARFRVQSEAALQALGQLVFQYSSATEKLKINYVRVVKSDGTVVAAGDSAVQDMTAPVAREAPMYSDLREKHITVPSLRPGEVLEYEIEVEETEPLAPGQFWMEHTFQKEAISLNETLELNIPVGRKIQLKTEPGFDPKITEENGRKIYLWAGNHLAREEKKKKKDGVTPKKKPSDRSDVVVTTFANWDELGKWYSGLEKNRRVATPELAAKAKELTKDAKTDREKAEAIYDYVAKNFRYVSLSFGIGRYQPHAAADIFADQYGDCKDKHTLLAAMLNSAGIPTDTVLIHSQHKLDKDIPSPSQFDHVITAVHLGDQRTIVDTTSEVAPFGMLWEQIRNKDALLITPEGKTEIVRTPADLPFPGLQEVDIDGKITELGRLERHVKYTARGDLELAFRTIFRRIPQPKWNDMMQAMALYDGMSGDVKDVKVSDLADTHHPIEVEFTIVTPNFLDFSSRKSKMNVPLPAMRIPVPDEDSTDPYRLGGTGLIKLAVQITVPEKFKITAPLPITMKRDYAEFQSSYGASNGVITAARELKVLLPEVPIARASDISAFRNVVDRDSGQEFGVEIDEVGSAAAPKDADPEELDDAANSAFRAGNYKLAIELWKKVVEADPKHKTAWNNLGRAYLNTAQFDKAEEALKKQTEVNPYDEYAYNNLGLTYQRTQRFDEAEKAYRRQIEVNPLDHYAHANLAQMLSQRHKYTEAIPEYEQAIAIAGENVYLQQQLGDAYLKTGKVDKAMENFDKALKTSPTPIMWNNVAYALAEENQALDRAEKYALSAVSMTVASLNNLPVDRLMDSGALLTNSLASYWDTLGWVYFREGKLSDAEKYVKASWELSESGEVGDHLAQIYEKQGHKKEAIEMYAKAMASSRTVPETRKRLAALAGDDKVNALVDSMRPKLGRDRTIELGKSDRTGSAEFKILLRGKSVETVQFVKGGDEFKSYTDKLKTLKYSGAAPDPDVRVLRSALLNCSKLTSRCDLVLLPMEVSLQGASSDMPPEVQELMRQLNQLDGTQPE